MKMLILMMTAILTLMLMSETSSHLSLMLIMVSTAMSIAISITIAAPWPSIMLFVIFVGGMMILFSFVASTEAPSPSYFNNPTKMGIIAMSLMLIQIGIPNQMNYQNHIMSSTSSVVLLMIIMLNINLTLMSKMLMKTNKALKSSST